MDNFDMLKLIDRALKGGIVEIDDLGDAVLQPTKLTKFVRQMQSKTKILPEARYFPMTAQIHEIDRIAFTGRVLHSGTDASSDHRSLATSNWASPGTNTNQLVAKEFISIASIRDKVLRRNIERENFEDTLIELLGEAVGRDTEELAIFGDTRYAYADDDILSKVDGWVKLAENVIYGGDKSDFDPSADTYPENMFDAMLSAMPKQYLDNINDWRFWVDWDVRNAYQNLQKARGTALGDRAYTTNLELAYKGVPVVYVPTLAKAKADGASTYGTGDVAILGYPNNHVWGVFHRVTIEREREAKERRTDFVLTLEADAQYEDENAVVVAYIDKSNPAS